MGKENEVFGWLPCSVVFISTSDGERRDIMTATAMFISEKAPQLIVSVAKGHLTEQLISQTEEFTLSIASEGQRSLAQQLGSVKGEREDKFKRFSIDTVATKSGGPLVPDGSAAWMECRVESMQDIDGYHLIIARVVESQNLGNAPLLWQGDRFFGLRQV